jgi:hypothetical protein
MAMAYREVSITSWLDPVFKYFAEQSGIPLDQYSSQVGGEGIGTALEIVADFFTKGWLNKTVQVVAGLIADGYAIWGKDVPTRLRRELLALGTHELLRFVDPKPSDVIEFQRSLSVSIDAAKRGDWNAFLASVLRTPPEIQSMLGVVAPLAPPTPAPPTPLPTPTGEGRYEVKSEAPTSPAPKKKSTPSPSPPPPPPPTKPTAETEPTPTRKRRYEVKG